MATPIDQATVARPGDSHAAPTAHVQHDATPTKPITTHHDIAAATATHVANGLIPHLPIDGADTHNTTNTHNFAPPPVAHPAQPRATADAPKAAPAPQKNWWDTAGTMIGDTAKGAWNEVTQHPGQVALDVGEGLAIGVGAVALAAVAPEAAVVVGVAAVGAAAIGAGVSLYQNGGQFLHDVSTIHDPSKASQADIAKAHADFNTIGGNGLQMGARIAGGFAAAPLADAATGLLTDGEQNSFSGLLKGAFNPDAPPPPPPAGDVPPPPRPGELHPQQGEFGSPLPTETPPAENIPDVRPAAAAAQPEPMTLQQTQDAFRSQGDSDNLVPSVKRTDYSVSFRPSTAGQPVPTIESVKAGTDGQMPNPGDWIATRLNADGTPNLEDGVVNQWPISVKSIVSKYNGVDADSFTGSDVVTGTPKPSAAPVHMFQLPTDTSIQTSRGVLSGHAGDWLANYDYDAATNTPGSDYAIVSKPSYDATYRPQN
ncbi:MAG TPA: hypothetical protein V6C81_28515 [Planktothrix sp.]|jgi:hypothetical protein